jgi:molybdopterin-guanine dinucleotide biosynthesis protein B
MRTKTNWPVIGIAGWKNSGKTTLAVRLIEEFTQRGLKVSSIKHSHHDVHLDGQESDSAFHRRAGAGEVALVGANRWALIHELEDEPAPSLHDILTRMSPCDLVIVEGYKSALIPKIEVRRSAQQDHRPLAPDDPNIVAIASDHPTERGALPLFTLDDVQGIAGFITRTVLVNTAPTD